MEEYQQAYVQCALKASRNKVRVTNNKRAGAESILALLLEIPDTVAETPAQEVQNIFQHSKHICKKTGKMYKEAPLPKTRG